MARVIFPSLSLSLVCASYFWIYFERDVCVFILLKRKPEARQRAPYLWLAPNGPLAISSSKQPFWTSASLSLVPIGQLGFWLPLSQTCVFLFPLDLFYSERVLCVWVGFHDGETATCRSLSSFQIIIREKNKRNKIVKLSNCRKWILFAQCRRIGGLCGHGVRSARQRLSRDEKTKGGLVRLQLSSWPWLHFRPFSNLLMHLPMVVTGLAG